jgi:hypothetical protein
MTVVPSAETVSVQVEPNETDKKRLVQTEYFSFEQEAGPCHSAHTCDCNSALEIIGGDYRGRSIECISGCTIEACEGATMQLRVISGNDNTNDDETIYIDGSGFYGPIARFDTNCITDIDIKWGGDKQDWLDFSIDDNYIIAQVDPLYSDISGRTSEFEIVYSIGTEDECSKAIAIEQKSNDKPHSV